jgi:hypothetical protein
MHCGVEVTTESSTNKQHHLSVIPEWWSRCKVRIRWETLEQGSEREKDSTVCIRITQVRTEGPAINLNVTAKIVEDDTLALVNLIREQCFQQAEDFAPGDIRYQGFEDREGLGRGIITITRRRVNLFEVDVAIGCLLSLYLGNGIQAVGGRAYKWCPFWGTMGATSAQVMSITRASDYYSKSRVTVTFGSQISGSKGWVITNPKEKMIRRMLQLLQQRAGSGPVLALLRMPVWEAYPRMFRLGQSNVPAMKVQEAPAPPANRQTGVTPERYIKVEGAQRLLKIAMDNGSMVDTKINEPSRVEPIDEAESSRPDAEGSGNRIQKTHPFAKCKIWHGPPGTIEVVYTQVKRLLDWEALTLITRDLKMHSTTRKVIMNQGTWCDEELTMAWERYMQTEGLCQHVNCQHCYSLEKPITVVTLGKMQQRRQLVCFCTSCWSFTSTHHRRDTRMDISFFKQFNPATGKFHRALPYADEEHPRRMRGPITDHELDQFRRDQLQLRKAGGPDKDTNELYRSLTAEELAVVREWADRALKDAQSASSVLTDEVLNCAIRLLHKGGDTNDRPSDWRPISLLNVEIQLVHHVINDRLTTITEVENLIVPGQDGGRAGRGVDLNQLKLDWVTSEAKRLKQRIIRIDIDFKNAFNSMSQSALWAVMRAYNIPDVDLLEAIYGRTTECMDPEDAKCAITTFLTGVIQGGASSPRIFIIFINALLEHLTCAGKALGISHGM